MDISKSIDFSGNMGVVNVLNTPDEYYITADQFWYECINEKMVPKGANWNEAVLLAFIP